MLWHHSAPWRPDPDEALLDFQVRFLAETYDLPSLVQERLESVKEAVRSTEAEGDEYGLLELYRDELAILEAVAAGPLPDAPREQIELVRKLHANSGEGVGNILDVVEVSDRRDYPTAERLADDAMERLVGTTRPTLGQAHQAVSTINEELRRGESVCFPYYEASDAEQPAGWYFVGNTID
jgi:hypothetical protein